MIVLATLHFMAETLSFYWIYWWYDWMMHFLAGLAGGLAAYWTLFDSGLWRRSSDKVLLPILSVLLCLMIVGVAWEIFEFHFGLIQSQEGYRLDTIHDLISDTVGAFVAALIGVRRTFFRHG